MEITYAQKAKGNVVLLVDGQQLDMSHPTNIVEALRAAHQEGHLGAAFIVTNDLPEGFDEPQEEQEELAVDEMADVQSDSDSSLTPPDMNGSNSLTDETLVSPEEPVL